MTLPGHLSGCPTFEQLECPNILLIQANLLNGAFKRCCNALERRIVEGEDVMVEQVKSLGIVALVDGVHPLQVAY